MTRINLIPPYELYDQHLIAEYREIRLLTALMKRSFASKNGHDKKKIPTRFTLNAGHVTFFKDKGKYIERRYQMLRDEMVSRGFTPKFDTIDVTVWPAGWFNDWEPTERDKDVIRERIALRVSERPNWYRYRGVVTNNVSK